MSFEPSDFQLADAVREQREARPESSVKFLHKVIKLKYPNWTLSETRLKKFIRSNPATEQQELPPNITSSSKAPNPPSAIASLDSATRAGNFVSASLPGGAVATAAEDRGKRPSQVPALSLPTPPTAGFAVVEELIASSERQRRLDVDRQQEFLQQFLQTQQQIQQQQMQNQQLLFQQQQSQQMHFLQQQMTFQQQQMEFQQQQQRQMQELNTTMKTVSEKLVQMESTLTSGLEVGGATSVDKLPSLDTLIASSAKVDQVSVPLHDSGVRISAPVSLQQPTIADVQAAPNPEVASQKGISDGGLVKVSDKAKIINRDPNSKFQVLRTAPPPGISASASFTLSVAVLEDQKFNPASYSDFVIREPGRPEMRVPVLSRLLQFTRLQVS